jgi:hypothetical protein
MTTIASTKTQGRLAGLLWFLTALAGPGEISLMLWLLAKGVNEQRWKEQASLGI